MPDPQQDPKTDTITVASAPGEPPKVYSPSPEPGEPAPKRRMEDTKSYAGEWTVLIIALLGWASTFCLDMAQEETFSAMMTTKFMGTHIAQLLSVTVSVLAAKRIK